MVSGQQEAMEEEEAMRSLKIIVGAHLSTPLLLHSIRFVELYELGFAYPTQP
ncbi:MAG: hypothetical protein KME12_16030 [Trichocoleus desertorum ATA4-8-CV12]|jgi:hypothetical protein|nr:hypothetical protein [Trichocoleus desertorum ATA4-8-CV12]